MFFQNNINSLCKPPREFFLKSFLFTFFFVFISSISLAQAKAEPKESKFFFGHVKRGEEIILSYEIQNTGNLPLILFEAEVSCSCTWVEFSKEPISPGKSTLVKIHFNTKSVWGRQDRFVYIKSNDPQSEIVLRYKGQVSKE